MRKAVSKSVPFIALSLGSAAISAPTPTTIAQALADAINAKSVAKINELTEGRIFKPKSFELGANPFLRDNLISAANLISDLNGCAISQIVGPTPGDKNSYIEWKCPNRPSPKGVCYDISYSGTIYQNRLGGYLILVAETDERSRSKCAAPPPPQPIVIPKAH